MRSFNRREVLAVGAAAIAGIRPSSLSAAADKDRPICVFTKPFNSLSFDELAERMAELGFDGIEAPIRKGGHIEPEAVEDKLPELVEALAKRKLDITVMTSDINDPRDPLTERVLRTAADLGIRRYRMKYLSYDFSQPIGKQLDEWRPQFRDLADLNRSLGIRALYQNHASGKLLGATLWDLRHVLRGIPADLVGVAYDIRHATVEGGMSWPITFRMIRPHVDTLYVKDFHWIDEKVTNVPLGEGLVDPTFVHLLNETGFKGPISLHEEYLDHRQPELVPEHLAAIKKDMATLRGWLEQ